MVSGFQFLVLGFVCSIELETRNQELETFFTSIDRYSRTLVKQDASKENPYVQAI
jgi:hypothetical protein